MTSVTTFRKSLSSIPQWQTISRHLTASHSSRGFDTRANLSPTLYFGIGWNQSGLFQHGLQAPAHVLHVLWPGCLPDSLGFRLEGQEIEVSVLVGTQLRQLILQRVQTSVQLGSGQHGLSPLKRPTLRGARQIRAKNRDQR
ncbi:MAG TPA: hypothetical protein VM687_11075 [Stenotrophomonas sp.]|nr:hypothetical protein [Stenotrophomonas sp.]